MVTATENNSQAAFRQLNEQERELLKKGLCAQCSPDEFDLFVATCNKTGLDSFMRQIYPIFRPDRKLSRNVMQIQVSIDGMRLVAERSGRYAGQIGPFWCGRDGSWVDVWLSDKEFPIAAKVGVMRHDFKEVLWAVARFSSYVQMTFDKKPNMMWTKFPDVMIAKCAEALALRKAFPMELSGLYSTEEMSQADNPEGSPASKVNTSPNTAPKPEKNMTAANGADAPAQRSEPDHAALVKTLFNMLTSEQGMGFRKEEVLPFISRTVDREIKKSGELSEAELNMCINAARDMMSQRNVA